MKLIKWMMSAETRRYNVFWRYKVGLAGIYKMCLIKEPLMYVGNYIRISQQNVTYCQRKGVSKTW